MNKFRSIRRRAFHVINYDSRRLSDLKGFSFCNLLFSVASKRPNKRSTAGSMTTQTLLDFDLSESSDDSDFRIEDHADESDDLDR